MQQNRMNAKQVSFGFAQRSVEAIKYLSVLLGDLWMNQVSFGFAPGRVDQSSFGFAQTDVLPMFKVLLDALRFCGVALFFVLRVLDSGLGFFVYVLGGWCLCCSSSASWR